MTAYLIEKFAETMELFPVEQISVISGAATEGPISAIHPNAVDAGVNRYIGEIMGKTESRGAWHIKTGA